MRHANEHDPVHPGVRVEDQCPLNHVVGRQLGVEPIRITPKDAVPEDAPGRYKSTGLPPRSPKKRPATGRPRPPHRGNGPPQSSDRTVSSALRLDSAGLARGLLRGPNPPAAPPAHQPRAHRRLPGNIKAGATPLSGEASRIGIIVFMIVGSILVNEAVANGRAAPYFQRVITSRPIRNLRPMARIMVCFHYSVGRLTGHAHRPAQHQEADGHDPTPSDANG
jgi:hypothetical protein